MWLVVWYTCSKKSADVASIIIIIKTSSTGPGGNCEVVDKLLNSFGTLQAPAPRKTEENTTQGSNQRLTAPLNPSSFPVSNSVGKVIPHSNLSRQERYLDTSNSNR